jgi:serine/threonine protein kinase
MRFYSGGDLESLIKEFRKGGDSWPIAERLQIGLDILTSLDALHRKGIIHRDIKPANVFLDDKRRASVGDFGGAICADAKGSSGSHYYSGTRAYLAPEAIPFFRKGHLTYRNPITGKSDVWCAGIILYLLIDHTEPSWIDDSLSRNKPGFKPISQKFFETQWLPSPLMDQEVALKLLIDDMLQIRPSLRVSSHEALLRLTNIQEQVGKICSEGP